MFKLTSRANQPPTDSIFNLRQEVSSSGFRSSNSEDVPERDMLVLQRLQSHPLRNVWMHLAAASIILQNCLFLLVLPSHPEIRQRHIDRSKGKEAEHGAMAFIVAWWTCVDPGAHDREGDPKDLGKRPSGSSLGEIGGVDGQPDGEENPNGVASGGD